VGVGGSYITHEHTVKHCRSGEIWYPRLLDRTAVGAETEGLYERAHMQVAEILKRHKPQVDDRVRKELEAYVKNLA